MLTQPRGDPRGCLSLSSFVPPRYGQHMHTPGGETKSIGDINFKSVAGEVDQAVAFDTQAV
jgi:hypothetical protein